MDSRSSHNTCKLYVWLRPYDIDVYCTIPLSRHFVESRLLQPEEDRSQVPRGGRTTGKLQKSRTVTAEHGPATLLLAALPDEKPARL